MKELKKIIQQLIIGIIISSLLIIGCVVPQGNVSKKKSNTTDLSIVPKFERAVAPPSFAYPYGLGYASYDAAILDLQVEYEEWKANYVTSSGANGNLRVQRDAGSNYDTVSEGVAYGMLLAVYFDDPETFDGLYRYVLDHPCDTFAGVPSILMHWKVDADGIDISEFGEYNLEGTRDAQVPHGVPFYNLTTGDVRVLPHFSEYPGASNPEKVALYEADVALYTADPDYVQFAEFGRDLGSATDADVDIAVSLIFASIKWGVWNDTGDICYHNEARAQIQAIANNDISGTLVKAGSAWGGENGWNPCYFTPTWFRIFEEFYPESADWPAINTGMFNRMGLINAINSPAGLYPDWLSTLGGVVGKATLTDRVFYMDESSTIDNVNGVDDINGDGIITYPEDGYKMQSYNFFYDAIRVPWRMAIDYSWYGDAQAMFIARKIGYHFRGEETSIVDGYAIDGSAWNWNDRDGFNDHIGGQPASAGSLDFTSMIGTSSLSLGTDNEASAEAFYQAILNGKKPYTGDYHYYGNTLRLLSLLYLSGQFINYWDTDGYKVTPREPDVRTIGPLTIDIAYAESDGYSVFGKERLNFNDRAAAYNYNGSGFSNIGAGYKTDPGITSRSGCDSQMKDLVLKTANVNIAHRTHIWGNALISGNLNLQSCSMNGGGLFADNLTGDLGALEFTANESDFIYDLSNNPTYQPGESIDLVPGVYGNVSFPGRNVVTLSAGEYHFATLTVEPDTIIIFPDTGVVKIYAAFDFDVRSRTRMVNGTVGSYSGADPSRILVVVGGNNAVVEIQPQVSWRGTLVVPNNRLDFNNHNPAIHEVIRNVGSIPYTSLYDAGETFGAIYAENLEVHQDSPIFHIPLQWDLF